MWMVEARFGVGLIMWHVSAALLWGLFFIDRVQVFTEETGECRCFSVLGKLQHQKLNAPKEKADLVTWEG